MEKQKNTSRNIFIAFILNLFFATVELFGGIFTNSVAIMSDAMHDFGDALSIGIAFILEKKSQKKADDIYTYGYGRYSVLGAVITSVILFVGSVLIIYRAVHRIIAPEEINSAGMTIFAIFGTVVNFIAMYFTKDGENLNQKAINLHMLEDVAGWIIVFVGSVIMNITGFTYIDPILSICLALFILIQSIKMLINATNLFLEKAPKNPSLSHLKETICKIEGVISIHDFHIWTIDGINNCATLHAVIEENAVGIKEKIRNELYEHDIGHATIETETVNEPCGEDENHFFKKVNSQHMHHHHSHCHKHNHVGHNHEHHH